MHKLIACITEKTPLTDVGKHIKDWLWEFRCDVGDGRIFRVFFIFNNGLNFLNGFRKKSQKTPDAEILKARKLIKLI